MKLYHNRVALAVGAAVVAEHPREFVRGAKVLDAFHVLPLLERKHPAVAEATALVDWRLAPVWAAGAGQSLAKHTRKLEQEWVRMRAAAGDPPGRGRPTAGVPAGRRRASGRGADQPALRVPELGGDDESAVRALVRGLPRPAGRRRGHRPDRAPRDGAADVGQQLPAAGREADPGVGVRRGGDALMARRGPVPQADDRRGGNGDPAVDADVAKDALTRAHRERRADVRHGGSRPAGAADVR